MAAQKPLILKNGIWQQIDASVDTVDPATLGTGTRDGTKFLRDDGTWQAAGGGGVSDGDKGDIVVSDSGATWTLEDQFKRSAAFNAYVALGSEVKGTPITPYTIGNTAITLTSQQIRWIAVWVPYDATINGVMWIQTTPGTYTASNYNGVGLYSYSGGTITLVASSTDDGDIWKSFGKRSKSFSEPYSASAGLYYACLLYSQSAQTTAPVIVGAPSLLDNSLNTLDFANTAKVNATQNTQSSLPASRLMSALSNNAQNTILFLI